MHRTLAKLRSAIAVLLVAVLMIVPVADAFACSLESSDIHGVIALDDHASSPDQDVGSHDDSDDSHGTCVHGHCHHSAANIPTGAMMNYDAVRVVRALLPDAPPAAGILEELLRPPRV